jgi:NAD-dependent deacetylase
LANKKLGVTLKPKLVVLSGAGISVESGINTLSESTGVWEGRHLMDVASEHGWRAHPGLVLDFYNERRREISAAKPNAAHYGLAALQDDFDVHVVTTNIDDLHERAGSTHVIHLHGNITKMRSEKARRTRLYDIACDIHLGDVAEDGGQLMPDIVWFGEPVPEIGPAEALAASADVFVVIGTTLSVYPAAGLIDFVRPETLKFLIDNSITRTWGLPNLASIEKPATQGVPDLINRLHQYRNDSDTTIAAGESHRRPIGRRIGARGRCRIWTGRAG